jgi:hypothetical protein
MANYGFTLDAEALKFSDFCNVGVYYAAVKSKSLLLRIFF